MVSSRPDDPRARFGLALEFERREMWAEAIEQLQAYLGLSDDEGNAYGRLARALVHLGRVDEARVWFTRGIEAAERFRHPTLAMELQEELESL